MTFKIPQILKYHEMGLRWGHRNARVGKVDLHIHSHYSDGFHSPHEILEASSFLGLWAIAVADHDTMTGSVEAQRISALYNVEVVPAIELTVEMASPVDFHVLGYFLRFENRDLIDGVQRVREARVERAREIIQGLNKSGIRITEGEVKAMFPFGYMSDQQISEILLRKGYARTFREARGTFVNGVIEKNNIPNVVGMSLEDSIRLIRQDGGVPIWAHPVIGFEMDEIYEIFRKLTAGNLLGKNGLAGFEGQSGKYKKEDADKIAKLAEQFKGLAGEPAIETAGTDFHRAGHGLGVGAYYNVSGSYEIVQRLKEAAQIGD